MTEQTTLLENDIARLSENIAEQYAIDAHYFEDQSIKDGRGFQGMIRLGF